MVDKTSLDDLSSDLSELTMTKKVSQNVLVIEEIKVVENEEFIHFATKGWETQVVIGIDFTSSNINQSKPESLHH